MDIENIRTFITLSSTKNYTRTARQMFVAQSTVTNRINELEKELQFPLFSRNNRSVTLTPEGEQFLIYAEKIIELTDSSLSEISSLKKYENQYRIGCSDSIYDGHLANLILNHQHNYPQDSIKIIIGLSSQLIEQVQANILDIVFTYLPLNKSNYKCKIFKQEPMLLVTDYKNSKYIDGITREQLLSENYLMCNFALQDVGQFIRNLFPKYHQFSLEIDDCSKIIPFLIDQCNYTFLPEDMAQTYIDKKILRSIPLVDFNTPVINSYIIGKKSKIDAWEQHFTN
ncbi:MAG: LysR family transcriptional regulator [Lachnospiraceae bacterium]|nr:LysR family transcriptional regulator [Lachnospiraceae bacterium]